MTYWTRFGKIEPAYKLARDFMPCNVFATEKIHGSNASIMADPWNGSVEYFSRTQHVTDAKDGNFTAFRRIMEEQGVPERLAAYANEVGRHIIIYGELYGSKVQNCGPDLCRYLPPGEFGFVMFAVKIMFETDRGVYYDWENVLQVSERLRVPVVPVMFKDMPFMEVVRVFEENDSLSSLLAQRHGIDSQAEGVVIMTNPILYTCHGSALIGKFKTRRYEGHGSERTKAAKTPKEVDPTIIEFAQRMVTIDRIASIYSHGAHEFKHEMSDMKLFVEEQLLIKDIEEECADDPVWTPKDDEDPDKRRKVIRKEIGRLTAQVVKAYLKSYHC